MNHGRAGLATGVRACTLALLLTGCAALPEGADLVPDSALSRYDLARPAQRWPLPDVLEEASGLTADGSGSLLTHHDNDARLWQLTLQPSLVVTPLGGPWIDGDFEGVARRNGTLYLLRSPGEVYRRMRERSAPMVLETAAAGGLCNFEGIELDADGNFLLACKYPRTPQPGTILLYRLEAGTGNAVPVTVDVAPLLRASGLRRLRPSGLAWLPDNGHLLVLAGKERMLLEIDMAEARLLAWRSLPARHHRQPEGLAVLPDCTIAIADEGDGRAATLTLYRPK